MTASASNADGMAEHLDEAERAVGVRFENKHLLIQALTHSSYVNEHRDLGLESNERLEFLGDAVISLAAAHYYFKNNLGPPMTLTELRKAKVEGFHLAEAAKRADLGRCMLLGKGETDEHGAGRQKILEGCFEAIAGAIFVDKGYDTAEQFIVGKLLEQGG